MINFVSPFPPAHSIPFPPSIQCFLPLLQRAFHLFLRELGCFGRCHAFLLELAQLWSLPVNIVQRFFIEISQQNYPNWHILLKEEDWVSMLLSLLIYKISPRNSNRDFNKLSHRCFPRGCSGHQGPLAKWCLATMPRDKHAIALGITPFAVNEILFTLSEVGFFSTYDCFLLVFFFQSHSALWDLIECLIKLN